MSFKIIKTLLFTLLISTPAVAEYNLRHQYSENGIVASFFIDDKSLFLVEHKDAGYFIYEAIYSNKIKTIHNAVELPWKPTHVDFFQGKNVSIVSSSSKNSHENAANEIYFFKNGKVLKIIKDAFGFTMSRNNKYAVVFKGDAYSQNIEVLFYDHHGNILKNKKFNKNFKEIAGEFSVADDLSAFTINWGSREIGGKYKQHVYYGPLFEKTLEFDYRDEEGGQGDNVIYHIEAKNEEEIYVHVSFNNRDRILKYINNKIVWEYELPYMKWLNQLGFSNKYDYVIVASNPGSFAVLNSQNGEMIVEHQLENLHRKRNLKFLPETRELLEFKIRGNKLFIYEKYGNKLHLYSLINQKLLKTIDFDSTNDAQNHRQISPSGKRMISFKPNSGDFYLYDINN